MPTNQGRVTSPEVDYREPIAGQIVHVSLKPFDTLRLEVVDKKTSAKMLKESGTQRIKPVEQREHQFDLSSINKQTMVHEN